ncbi:Protein CBG21990 [Caenorhabditis briggsae]|uniref:Glycosyltransferase family 92 protein n=1 Tax=Caenorhabditis briggsae TaxID=6238 RepID=A8Y1A4_CAEBR|nr:Protein CBG21990 [Caenorhabditis briggsae]CAP38673.2 Protein CBG21990 [Caenorhabditis briggsae]
MSKKIKVTKLHVLCLILFILSVIAIRYAKDIRYAIGDQKPEKQKRPLKAFILSAYFYTTSESLGNNSLALVMSMNIGRNKNEQLNGVDQTKLTVMARNFSAGVVLSANYERITLHDNCQMITVFATLQLLPNPTQIALMTNETQADIPYKIPSYAKRDVVFCISPIYVSELWQSFLTAAHIYKQTLLPCNLGIDLTFLLYHLTLLMLIKKRNFRVWQPPKPIESAKFVALFELNDILVPKVAPTYVEEFESIIGKSEGVAYLSYQRRNFDANVYNSTGFSIQSMLDSLADKNTKQIGKVVVVPKNLNYTWMDRPLHTPDGFVSIDVTQNEITYIENITWIYDEPAVNTDSRAGGLFSNNSKNYKKLYGAAFVDIENELQFILSKEPIAEIVPTLPNFYYFYYLVNKCFEEKYYKFLKSESSNWVKNTCPGPQICGFYQHPKVDCVHVNAQHVYMKEAEPITYYYATSHHYSADIGCYAH